jgi:glycosyltransferase involved in cell wall biosynthesis
MELRAQIGSTVIAQYDAPRIVPVRAIARKKGNGEQQRLIGSIPRLCVVCEWIHGAGDEGFRNFAHAIATYWPGPSLELGPSESPQAQRLFLDSEMAGMLQAFQPDVILYVPVHSTKPGSFVRARLLKRLAPEAFVAMAALQPSRMSGSRRQIARFAGPDALFVQSPEDLSRLADMPYPVHFMPSGVDSIRFAPVTWERKRALRRAYDVPEDATVVLHVGHLNRKRNISWLELRAEAGEVYPLAVVSSSTPHDPFVADDLTEAGVHLIDRYLPNIHEIFQLADAYLFPVQRPDSAIGVPLSVLEAMACNLHVLTTPFGGLPLMFPEGEGLWFFNSVEELPSLLDRVCGAPAPRTRELVLPYDWKNVASNLLRLLQEGTEGPSEAGPFLRELSPQIEPAGQT